MSSILCEANRNVVPELWTLNALQNTKKQQSLQMSKGHCRKSIHSIKQNRGALYIIIFIREITLFRSTPVPG